MCNNSKYGHDAISIADYAQNRLSTDHDDRCDETKIHADAWLRGKFGNKANEIIQMIDEHKSRH